MKQIRFIASLGLLLRVALGLLLSASVSAQPTLTWRQCVMVPDTIAGEAISMIWTRHGNLRLLVGFREAANPLRFDGLGFTDYTAGGTFEDTVSFRRLFPVTTGFYRFLEMPSGDWYVSGSYATPAFGHGTTFLARFDSAHHLLWRTDLDTVGANSPGLVLLPNGALMGGGRGTLRNGMNWNDAILRRIDATGRVRWLDTLGGNYTLMRALAALPDGSYVAVLSDPSRRAGVQGRFSHDHLLVRLHANGTVLDTVWVGQPDDHDEANVVRPTADGGLVLAGWRAVAPTASAPRQGVLIKLDSLWHEQWRQSIFYPLAGGNYYSGAQLYDVQELANGHFLVIGSETKGVMFEVEPPANSTAAPTILWRVDYTNEAPPDQLMVQAPATAYLHGGYCGGIFDPAVFPWLACYDGLSAGPAELNMCARPPVFADSARWAPIQGRLDTLAFTLNPLTTHPGPRYAEVSEVQWTYGDGTPADTGWATTHRFLTPTPVRVQVCVTNNLFCRTCQTLYPYGIPASVGLAEAAATAAVRVYPNPSMSGQFTVAVGEAPLSGATFTVIDAVGRTVAIGALTGAETLLDLRHQPSGVYALRLRWPDGRTVSKRLLR